MTSPVPRADAVLSSQRLVLVPLRGDLVRRRLADDAFAISLPTPEPRLVHVGPAWPRQLLPLFRLWGEALGDDDFAGAWVVVDRATWDAVGDVGIKGEPAGEVEIGYGMVPEVEGRGVASEAVRVLVAHLRGIPAVTAVTAETALDNPASARVLEKNGFVPTGERDTEEDGRVQTWRHAR